MEKMASKQPRAKKAKNDDSDLVVVVLDEDLASLGGDDAAADCDVELPTRQRFDPYVITLSNTLKNRKR